MKCFFHKELDRLNQNEHYKMFFLGVFISLLSIFTIGFIFFILSMKIHSSKATFLLRITIISCLAGIFGGYVNSYINQSFNCASLKKNILCGLLASFLAPLFLTTISSSILSEAQSGDPLRYFHYFGITLLASVFSNEFIINMRDKILKIEQKNKDTLEQLSEGKQTLDTPENPYNSNETAVNALRNLQNSNTNSL